MGSQYILPSGGGGGGGGGDVVGPNASIPNSLPIFADGTGKLLADTTILYTSGLTYVALYPDTLNDDLVLAPNGDGSVQGQIADGLPSGGNARGAFATDWQRSRTDAAHVASAPYSTISGGADSMASADYSTVVGGLAAHATHYGEVAFASGFFTFPGDAQTSFATFRISTANALGTVLTLDGLAPSGTNLFVVPSGTAYKFRISLVASENATSDAAWWEFNGCIKRDLVNTTSLVGVNAVTFGADAGAAQWLATVTANDIVDALTITVTGEAGKTIRWVATGQFTKVNG